jgi:hypothetical protein
MYHRSGPSHHAVGKMTIAVALACLNIEHISTLYYFHILHEVQVGKNTCTSRQPKFLSVVSKRREEEGRNALCDHYLQEIGVSLAIVGVA